MSPADTVREGALQRTRIEEMLSEYGDYDHDTPLGRVFGTCLVGEFVGLLRVALAASQPAPVSGLREALRDVVAGAPCVCPECGGDGRETCTNPDHSFIVNAGALGAEIGRLGCPGCGHDPHHKVPNGGKCRCCEGTGTVSLAEYIKYTGDDFDAYVSAREDVGPARWMISARAALAQAPEADKARAELIGALEDMLDYYEPGLTEPEVFEVEAEVLRNARVVFDRHTFKPTSEKPS